MELSFFVATVTSLLTVALGITLLQLMRQERQRSDARVAALTLLAAEPAPVLARAAAPSIGFDAPPVKLQPRVAPARRTTAVRAQAPARPIAATAAEMPLVREPFGQMFGATAGEIDVTPAGDAALFAPAKQSSGAPLLYIAAAALLMAGVMALSFTWALSGSAAPTAETTASIEAPAAAAAQPLALVSLRHEHLADGTLVISGVVRNPSGSIVREKIYAAASLLDNAGSLVASVRAPLDFVTLPAGEESPFVVKVAGAAGIARYRIGFRDADGTSVAHIDKR